MILLLRKIIIALVVIFFIAIVSYFGVIFVMGKMHPQVSSADAIIVLGAAHENMATQRALKGFELYRERKSGTLVLSGGKTTFPVSEAQYMKSVILRYASTTNASSASATNASSATNALHIILEEDSLNTYENLRNSKLKIPNAKSIIIVTDQFHIARSVLIAKSLGYQTVYWDSPDPSYLSVSSRFKYYISEMKAVVGESITNKAMCSSFIY